MPCSTMRPWSITRMRSQDSTVASRCAITSVVRWRINSSSAVCTSVSDSASSDEVASSSSNSGASRRIARAIAMRWRWPPDSVTPRSPSWRFEAAGQAADEFGGMGEIGGALDLGIGGVGPAEADVFARGGGEHHRILRHQRDARAHLARIGRPDRHAVERDRAGRRIVEPQQQMKQRALAGAGGADDRDLLAGAHRERNAVDRQRIRPRRIGEADIVETDIAARRHRQRARRCRRRDRRLDAQNFEQPFRRAGGGRDLAPDLAELAEPGRGERRIQHELAEPARA